jgi:pimeloyl-ACP methyl ester carboxylesterase
VAFRVIFYLAVFLLLVPIAFAWVMTRAVRLHAPGPPPAGFALGQVVTSDGLRLRTWTLAGSASRPVVVIAHGVGDSLESFVDEGLWFAGRGHPVVLLDLRGHGGSEGRTMTLGAREREDVRAVMESVRASAGGSSGFILVGHSMGAVAALRAAADRDDVRAVIVEAPYDSYRNTIARHARLLYGLPRWFPLIPVAIFVAERWAGFDADEVDVTASAARVRGALLAIADGGDDRMPPEVVRRVFDAHHGPKRFWVAPGAPHVGAGLDPGYWPQVEGFLRENGL